MFEKDGSVGTLCPIIMAKCGFGGARPPGEPSFSSGKGWGVTQPSRFRSCRRKAIVIEHPRRNRRDYTSTSNAKRLASESLCALFALRLDVLSSVP